MYTFSQSEYKWCPQCAGNIRLQATHCRFCRKPIENRLMKKTVLKPFMTIASVTAWVPSFADLKAKCHEEFLRRLEEAEAEAPPPVGGPLTSASEESLRSGFEQPCPHEPPEPHVSGLLFDVLLSNYHRGQSLAEVCSTPRLQLLEITPQEVAAEYELRKEERGKGIKCRYCQEFLMTMNEECRFCSGSEEKAPVAIERFFNKPIDQQLLKEVILYEAAWRCINEGEALSAELTDKHACSQKEIEQEILRQRMGQCVQPMSRFSRRMLELNLTSYWTPEQLALMAIAELGMALTSKNVGRSDEAQIVLEHALRRTEGKDELMRERGTVLSNLALVFHKIDDAKFKLYTSMAQECNTFGMSDDIKAMMAKSNERIQNMFSDGNLFEADPEKRLAALDKDFADDPQEVMGSLAKKLEESLPGLGELMGSLSSSLKEMKKNTRLILEAQVAQKNGDLEQAESKFTEALANTKEDSISGRSSKISIMCSLAEVKHQKGDDAAAEPLLKEALEFASEYAEAEPSLGKSSLWPVLAAFACFLKDAGRYDESERHFLKALVVQDESTSYFVEKYGGARADYNSALADTKEKYAQLLRALKRDQEAEKIDAEVIVLKKDAEIRAAELESIRNKSRPGQKIQNDEP